MKIAFRTNGGGDGIGLGHVMRCLAVAEECRKQNIMPYFVIKDYPAGMQVVKEYDYEIRPVSHQLSVENDLAISLALIQDADGIFLDSYDFTTEYLREFSKNGKIVGVFDDLMNKELPVDLVVGGIYATANDYLKLKQLHTKVLTGPNYFPFRKEFRDLTKKTGLNERLEHVLITMGGEDEQNVTKKIIEFISNYTNNIKLHILMGNAYCGKKDLEIVLQNYKHEYILYENVKNVVDLYQKVDVAITAGGVSTWELAAIGTPMIVVQTADNQFRNVKYLAENKLGLVAGGYVDLKKEKLTDCLNLMQNKTCREKFSKKEISLFDCCGVERIVNELIGCYIDKNILNEDICLRNATLDDSKIIWEWRNDKVTREMSRSSEFISMEKHTEWYASAINEEKNVILMAHMKDFPLGVLRFDYIKNEDYDAEVSINLNPLARGRGLGKKILKLGCDYASNNFKMKKIRAEIKQENVRSIKIFSDVGFIFQGINQGLYFYKLSYR